MNEFKNYKRELIQITNDTIILLHIFEKDKTHSFEEIDLYDCDAYTNEMFRIRKESAKQFIKQFEGNECMMFIKALKEECEELIKKDEEKKAIIKKIHETNSAI